MGTMMIAGPRIVLAVVAASIGGTTSCSAEAPREPPESSSSSALIALEEPLSGQLDAPPTSDAVPADKGRVGAWLARAVDCGVSRRGFDPTSEIRKDPESAFRDLEVYLRTTPREVGDLEHVLGWLGATGVDEAAPLLREYYQSPGASVRGSVTAYAALLDRVRLAAIRGAGLAVQSDEARLLLLEAVSDSSPSIRVTAVEGLARGGRAEDDALIDRVAETDPSPDVRLYVRGIADRGGRTD